MRLLLVDDEPELLELMRRALERHQHTVTTADSPAAAEAAFGASRFDAAILDLSLPGRSGEELALDFLTQAPDLRVIIATGYPYSAAHLAAGLVARISVLQKPFLTRELVRLLDSFVSA
jgi:DNA-binding response OmpR family regulator